MREPTIRARRAVSSSAMRAEVCLQALIPSLFLVTPTLVLLKLVLKPSHNLAAYDSLELDLA